MTAHSFTDEIDELMATLRGISLVDYGGISAVAAKASAIISKHLGNNELSLKLDKLADDCCHALVTDWLVKRPPIFGQLVMNELIKAKVVPVAQFDVSNDSKAHNLTATRAYDKITNNAVFIVHGHDEEMKKAVEEYIKELKLEPVILHKQPNKNRTIIEKFEAHSDVGFAVGLLSPDDWYRRARARKGSSLRCPRQNVILETGFFIGKLGRHRVMLLVKKRGTLEYPSDYNGVLYTPYDDAGEWKKALALELHHANYKIDPAHLPPTE